MLDSKVLNTDYDLAEMRDLCLPNLLDNADFKSGIINQRSNEEYNLGTGNTGNKPTIDRWIGNCTYVKPYDGYLYIKDNIDTSKAYLYQNLSSVCNGDYTVYINISSMSGGTLNLYFGGELSNKFTISEQGEHIYTFEGVSNQNKFALELDGFEGNIECIKLEKGSVFTGMPQWDFALEWFKCQRYLYVARTTYTQYQESNIISGYIGIPCPMAKVPSVFELYVNNLFTSQEIARETDISQFNCSTKFLSTITLSKNIPVGTYALSVAFDAETYI